MEIKVCTTNEWSDKEWLTYQLSFNIVFKKEFDIDFFKHKYLTVIDGYSYHALLLNEEQNVVGGCSVCPYLYKNDEEIIKLGQAVDVFIIEEYRIDPLMLRRMYFQLKKLLIINDIKVVLAVPNETAYPYWKNIVKWKDVGDIPYWIIPLKVGNIFKRFRFLNTISFYFFLLWSSLNYVISLVYNSKQRKSSYELITDDNFCKYRYSDGHRIVMLGEVTIYFKIYDEDGVRTAYLIDAKQDNKHTYKSLVKGILYLSLKTKCDLILFVGQLKFFQMQFIKVPKRFEPKRLPLTCDILKKDEINKYADMLNFKNWNYGLINYDVR